MHENVVLEMWIWAKYGKFGSHFKNQDDGLLQFYQHPGNIQLLT